MKQERPDRMKSYQDERLHLLLLCGPLDCVFEWVTTNAIVLTKTLPSRNRNSIRRKPW